MIKNMKQFNQLQHSSSLLLLVMITLIFTTTLAQSPASSPPAPSALAESPTTASSPAPSASSAPSATGRTNLVSILQKAGKFTILIRLLRSTHFIDQLNSLITTTNQGVTFFAPPDSAFSRLPSGTINSFTDQQKTQLVQFHALPTYVPILQFQTLSNPVQTQAGNSVNSKFPLNITTSGTSVSMTTGTVKARVTRTIYTDGVLAVYQVDQVLLPIQFHVSLLPPALAPSVPEKAKSATSTSAGNASVRITKYTGMSFAIAVIAVIAAIAL